MAKTYIYDKYSEGLLKATIRKSLVGDAARHLRCQGCDRCINHIAPGIALWRG